MTNVDLKFKHLKKGRVSLSRQEKEMARQGGRKVRGQIFTEVKLATTTRGDCGGAKKNEKQECIFGARKRKVESGD